MIFIMEVKKLKKKKQTWNNKMLGKNLKKKKKKSISVKFISKEIKINL